MAKIDKPVSKKPFDIFDNLDDAIAWAKAHHV
jgi:hypothetical protein